MTAIPRDLRVYWKRQSAGKRHCPNIIFRHQHRNAAAAHGKDGSADTYETPAHRPADKKRESHAQAGKANPNCPPHDVAMKMGNEEKILQMIPTFDKRIEGPSQTNKQYKKE